MKPPLHTLLRLPTRRDLEGHPKVGASWEGFAISQVVQHVRAAPGERFFWATHAGAELDLLLVRGRNRMGFEFKLSSAPKVTKSMKIAIDELKLKKLYVVHAGKQCFDLHRKIRAIPLSELGNEVKPWS